MDRLGSIDVARGLGILAVVLGHNWFVIAQKGELYNIIFSFHMPLFFLLSGVFFSTNKGFLSTAFERADSLLKPYFVTLIGISGIYIYYKGASPLGYYLGVLYGNGATIAWTPLWFLTHLWIVCIFSFIFIRVTRLDTISLWAKISLLFTLLVTGYLTLGLLYKIPISTGGAFKEIFGEEGKLPGLPFSFDIILLSSFFFLIGYSFKKYILSFKVNYVYLATSIVLFAMLHLFFDYTIDFNLRIYQSLPISTLEALIGIYIILSVSHFIPVGSRHGVMFAKIGASSMFILIFHRFFQDNTFNLLNGVFKEAIYVNGLVAFVTGVIAPMIIWFLIKSSNALALFWLPVKRNKLLQRSEPIAVR